MDRCDSLLGLTMGWKLSLQGRFKITLKDLDLFRVFRGKFPKFLACKNRSY